MACARPIPEKEPWLMGWLILFVMLTLIAACLWRFGHVRGGALQLIVAALFVGVAGYAWQGQPWLSGTGGTSAEEESKPHEDSAFAIQRSALMDRFGRSAQILDAADAMHRAGLDGYSVALIRGGLAYNPNDPDLLVGMGNALILYAHGMITPAAEYAFNRASEIAPDRPAAPYFLGLAYVEAGQLDRTEAIWSEFLKRGPKTAPWRSGFEQRLDLIRKIEGQAGR
jgi:tetratricopeptide (TPR) repeat protein